MLIYAINFSPVKRKRSLRCTTSSKPGRIHHVWWLDHTANACCWCDERPRGQSDQWLIGSDWLRLRVRVSGLGLVLFVSYTSVALKLGAQCRMESFDISYCISKYRTFDVSKYRIFDVSKYRTFDVWKYRIFDVSKYRTCFALHPLTSPVFLMQIYTEWKLRCI